MMVTFLEYLKMNWRCLMKIGDMVRWKNVPWYHGIVTGIVVSELRHGMNSSFVDVLVNGEVIPVNWLALEVIK